MSELKKLKKDLAALKHSRKMLPNLIDCSSVFGDHYYTHNDLLLVDKMILGLQVKIDKLNGKAV